MSNPRAELKVGDKLIGETHPVYFVADIAANHDGDLSRAKELIYRAKASGADAAKFQHFAAERIVSDYGFKSLGKRASHQSKWRKSVFEVYSEASIGIDWTESLKEACELAGIAFMTSPYDFDLLDHVDPYVVAHKIGSGDITWIEMIKRVARKGKPYMLATGASSTDDVCRAVDAGLEINKQLVLLQCNTNYTGSLDNMRHVQLNVLKTYRSMFPSVILGLSDHTPGHSSVLGAIALGAKVIEKHFTDDNSRVGPDHSFSMDPSSWRVMVERSRELEAALGDGVKRVEANELQTVVLQRRAVRAARDLPSGHVIESVDLTALRPCPEHAIPPYNIETLLGRKLRFSKKLGEHFSCQDFE